MNDAPNQIRNPDVVRSIRALAKRTGQPITDAVAQAVTAELKRRDAVDEQDVQRRLRAIDDAVERFHALPITGSLGVAPLPSIASGEKGGHRTWGLLTEPSRGAGACRPSGNRHRPLKRGERRPMKMKMIVLAGGLAAALTIGAVQMANAAKEKVYTLGGFTFSGFPGINTDELTAKLKDQAGARVTKTDLAADEAMFTEELKTRHIKGRLLISQAEKHGTIWLIFDLQRPVAGSALYSGEPLKAQMFEGATHIPATELAAATGLKPGDNLSFESIRAAHDALVALYAKSAQGKAPLIRSRVQVSGDGHITLTWLIAEQ